MMTSPRRGDRVVFQRLSRDGAVPKLLRGDERRGGPMRHRRRRHAQHLGHHGTSKRRWRRSLPICTTRKRASVHLRVRVELGRAVDAGQPPAERGDPVGRAEPRLHDRGHPPFPRQKVIWKHNDPEDLDRKLAALPANATKIVAFESVYSMDGDIARWKRSSRWRKARRDDLSRRGARGGHVWPARRRCVRA
jgi:hypothetical protein